MLLHVLQHFLIFRVRVRGRCGGDGSEMRQALCLTDASQLPLHRGGFKADGGACGTVGASPHPTEAGKGDRRR